MLAVVHTLWQFIVDFFKPRWRLQAENIATRMVPPQPSIDANDAMILPNDANPGRIEFSERTTSDRHIGSHERADSTVVPPLKISAQG